MFACIGHRRHKEGHRDGDGAKAVAKVRKKNRTKTRTAGRANSRNLSVVVDEDRSSGRPTSLATNQQSLSDSGTTNDNDNNNNNNHADRGEGSDIYPPIRLTPLTREELKRMQDEADRTKREEEQRTQRMLAERLRCDSTDYTNATVLNDTFKRTLKPLTAKKEDEEEEAAHGRCPSNCPLDSSVLVVVVDNQDDDDVYDDMPTNDDTIILPMPPLHQDYVALAVASAIASSSYAVSPLALHTRPSTASHSSSNMALSLSPSIAAKSSSMSAMTSPSRHPRPPHSPTSFDLAGQCNAAVMAMATKKQPVAMPNRAASPPPSLFGGASGASGASGDGAGARGGNIGHCFSVPSSLTATKAVGGVAMLPSLSSVTSSDESVGATQSNPSPPPLVSPTAVAPTVISATKAPPHIQRSAPMAILASQAVADFSSTPLAKDSGGRRHGFVIPDVLLGRDEPSPTSMPSLIKYHQDDTNTDTATANDDDDDDDDDHICSSRSSVVVATLSRTSSSSTSTTTALAPGRFRPVFHTTNGQQQPQWQRALAQQN